MCINPRKKLNTGNVIISKKNEQREIPRRTSEPVLSVHIETTTNGKVAQYQNQLTNLMDTLAPIKRKRVQTDMKQPSYDKQLPKKYN